MITIVTDSTVYMTKKEAADLGVRIVPITYTVSGRLYNETYSDCNGSFERLITMHNGSCMTSRTNTAVFMSTFEELLRQGHEVLCLTLSSRLSGTYSSASVAAREIGSSKIRIIDSLSTAGGMYLLVKKARKLINQGLNLDEAAEKIEALRQNISIAFSVEDMAPLRKSGRLGFVRQSVSTILNIKPLLLCVDGAVVSDDIVRGRQEQIRRLVSKVPAEVSNVIVHYLGEKKNAIQIGTALKRLHPNTLMELRPIGPALGIHIGMNSVGIVWMKK